MESTFADLSINSDGGIEILLEEDDDNGVCVTNDLCLVGRFLTMQTVNVTSMKNTLASVWRPMRGVSIKPIGKGRFLFQFHHTLDVNRILEGSPWSFNNHPLVLHSLQRGDHPLRVPLNKLPFWVQYDSSNRGAAWMTFMRIRVEVDTNISLKRWKKVGHRAGGSFLVHFKYEKLNSFCFVCGLLGHTENYCEIRFASTNVMPKREWGTFLRAPDRRGNMGESSRWLRGTSSGLQDGGVARSASESSVEAVHTGMGVVHTDMNVVRQGVVNGTVVSVSRHSTGINSMQTNPIFEDDNRLNILELEDGSADTERKRKRGKMIVADSLGNSCMELQALSSDDNSVIVDTPNVTAGLGYGACREL
ncbi:hypothetical protein ACS0TY_011600 [Phlomoides rotata]